MSFKTLDAEDFVVSADSVQSTAWSTDQPTLTTFFTSSVQENSTSANYYLSVYQAALTDPEAAVQFDVTYGNVKGSGSVVFDAAYPSLSPSSTIYGQYRTMILEDENSLFQFGDGSNFLTPDDIWVISPNRARYKESIFPGTLNLTITYGGNTVYLTDNSGDTTVQTFMGSSRVYQIVSGSNGQSSGTTGYVANSGSFGLLFPELGTILLNPEALNQEINLPVNSNPATNVTNPATLFDSIKTGASFTMNAQETITSDYIFVRSRNSEFNYSTNPSFISGSTGEVVFDTFINNPQTYITTVGMYNDASELIAVAKLSKPLPKDFTKESLVRVKLDF